MRQSPLIMALYVVAVAVLVGTTSAFVAFDKDITLNVNGETKRVHGFPDTVQGALDAAGVEVSDRDLVAPEPGAELNRGTKVTVRHARQLELTVDGKRSSQWVTALTVDEALDQLDLRTDGAELSASRSRRLPRAGFALEVLTRRTVSIQAGGESTRKATTAGSVREVLGEAGVRLGRYDKVDPSAESFPPGGTEIKVLKVLSKPVSKKVSVPYETKRKKNDEMVKGEKKVIRKGERGKKAVQIADIMRGGKKVEDEVIAEKVLRKTVTKVVEVGTKTPSVGGEAASLNWDALAQCESGGDPGAVNSAGGYYGLYQFSMSTWQSVGGSGKPSDAPASEQTYRAQKLYNKVGGNWQGQWPVCGRHLMD